MQHGERHALAGDAEKTPRPLGLCAPQPIGRDLDRAEAVVLDASAAHRGGNVTSSPRSEEHTSELQSLTNLVCRLLLEKKKNKEKSQTEDAHENQQRVILEHNHHEGRAVERLPDLP